MFSYVKGVGSSAYACTKDKFYELIRSDEVARLCAEVRRGCREAKRRLPAFCFHAVFNGNVRRNDNAVPSKLFMLDLDHVGDAEALWERLSAVLPENVVLAHVTPSCEGLRLVAVMSEGMGIGENQARLASLLGVDYDASVKDLARLSFCVPESYFKKIDERVFDDDYVWTFAKTFRYPDVPSAGAGGGAEGGGLGDEVEREGGHEGEQTHSADGEGVLRTAVADGHDGSCRGADAERDDDFIVSELIARLGGEPVEGERNVRLYALARYLRYIYDFRPETVASRIPHFGLGDDEVLTICTNACKSPRSVSVPRLLQRIVDESHQLACDDCSDSCGEVPPMPDLIRMFVDTCPAPFKPSMICALLPILGTLATNVRCVYLDRKVHSLSFMTAIIAPQASGKSFVRMPVEVLLEGIREKDMQGRLEEQAYAELLRNSKNSKAQPSEPKPVIRNIPVTVSIAKLLKRLDNASRQHLFSYAEEIDTLTKSNRAGIWAQKSDIYRLAFDNGEYGQDYMSDNTYSTVVNVYYNLLLCGTPLAVDRFFRDIEDGLVTRFIFSKLPDMFACEMPIFGTLSPRSLKYVREMVAELEADRGTYRLPRTLKALSAWLEQKRTEAMQTQSVMIDVFRKRSAVIGYRAGVVAYLLNGRKEGASVTKFAVWVASYVCRQQCEIFGEKMERYADGARQQRRSRVMNLFAVLPDEFTRKDLVDLRVAHSQSADVRMVINRWKAGKLIEEKEKNVYIKI